MELGDIKEFLVWCRSNGVYHIEIEGVKADIVCTDLETQTPKPIVVVHDEIGRESPDYNFPEYVENKPFMDPEVQEY